MYKVIIKEFDITGCLWSVLKIDDDLGYCIGTAMEMTTASRVGCYHLANVVKSLQEGAGENTEFWPGYNDALNRLLCAAQDITDGWENHDETFEAKTE